MIPSILRPSPTLTVEETERSLRLMTWESVASAALFSLGSGGLMAAYALALGANNLQVGILAALPSIMQVARLPAILAVERFRMRKAMGIPVLWAGHLTWIPIGATPLLIDAPGAAAVIAVIAALGVRGLFTSLWGTMWTGWMRDLVPRESLGNYHGRRLAIVTSVSAVAGLGASFFVRWWEGASAPGDAVFAYSILLIGGALTLGVLSPALALGAREPLMPAARESGRSALSILSEPLKDRNFSRLVWFLLAWSMALNLAIPFFAVYMLTKIGLSLPAVIGFTVISQAANALFTRVWGPMADRFGSKTVLSLSASLYLLVILGWVFTAHPERHALTLPLLALLHVFAGIAASGATLTMSTISLKIAPEGGATPFVGVANIAMSVGAGIGPIVGGFMAEYFSARSLELKFVWTSLGEVSNLPAVSLAGFEFLFVVAFVAGLLSLNLLSALREEGEISREEALSELTARAGPAGRAITSVPGLGPVSEISYGYIKRVPGADVALGVTAYQLAASTQAAVESTGRGRVLAGDVARAVGGVLERTTNEVEDIAEHGAELARHATRGAVHVGDDLTGQLDRVTRGAVLGALRAMSEQGVDPLDALLGSGYGAVEGAIETGEDPAQAAVEAVEAARQAAPDLGLADDAADALAKGALQAAEAAGEEPLQEVRRALDDMDL